MQPCDSPYGCISPFWSFLFRLGTPGFCPNSHKKRIKTPHSLKCTREGNSMHRRWLEMGKRFSSLCLENHLNMSLVSAICAKGPKCPLRTVGTYLFCDVLMFGPDLTETQLTCASTMKTNQTLFVHCQKLNRFFWETCNKFELFVVINERLSKVFSNCILPSK